MTPDELRPILTRYRKQVEQGWSKATAHPSFEGADGSPVGQCGVTSAWLWRRLREEHGVETLYCTGNYYGTPTTQGTRHCWLEHIDKRFIVLDLTADQFGGSPVVCASYRFLYGLGIHYITNSGLPAPDAVTADRAALLEAALA